MKLPGVPYQPRYTVDEIALGIAAAVALHMVAVLPFAVKALWPLAFVDEAEPHLVVRPVIQASLLKLGRPLDPKMLPDRFVPQARTAPKKQVVASREDPLEPKRDAGAVPPEVRDAEDKDLMNLIAKTDLFAEHARKARPDEGHAAGVDGGQETDPNKVKAGDMYLAQLGQFFAERNHVPTIISIGEARRLCAVFEMQVGRNMVIWHVRQEPVKSSGNPMFDDSARDMLLKLLDDKTPLPTPPKEFDEQIRSRKVQLTILGDPHGDPTRCR